MVLGLPGAHFTAGSGCIGKVTIPWEG